MIMVLYAQYFTTRLCSISIYIGSMILCRLYNMLTESPRRKFVHKTHAFHGEKTDSLLFFFSENEPVILYILHFYHFCWSTLLNTVRLYTTSGGSEGMAKGVICLSPFHRSFLMFYNVFIQFCSKFLYLK